MKWTCKYCRHHQIATEFNLSRKEQRHQVIAEEFQSTICLAKCLNEECGQVTISLHVAKGSIRETQYTSFFDQKEEVFSSLIRPDSNAIPQPNCIPQALRSDYYEACAIVDKSSKAAATLARRCLQGMISDFCGITKGRLVDQIRTLREQIDRHQGPVGVTMDSVDSIDDVRHVGNVGAHMEKDVNLVIDIEPNEAELLLRLVEQLFDEWYVEREARQKRRAVVKELAEDVKSKRTKNSDSAVKSAAEAAKDQG